LPQPGGPAWRFGEGQRSEQVPGGHPGHRAKLLQVASERRIDGGLKPELAGIGGLLVVQAMGPGDEARDEEILPGHLRDPRGERPVGVRVARAFIAGELQACQRIGGQVIPGKVVRVVQVEQV
jgi:hypothetical protein